MSRLTLGPGHRGAVGDALSVALPDRSRPRLRGLAYVLVGLRVPSIPLPSFRRLGGVEHTPARPLVGLVIVSHSARIAEGTVELAAVMAGPDVRLRAAGGAADGSLGTNAERIAGAITEADAGAGVVVLVDIGSAVLAAETALELLPREIARRTRISRGPVVEGAVIAAVQASIGQALEEVLQAAEDAARLEKR